MILTDLDLILDAETQCDLDIKTVGTFKYCRHKSFKLQLLSWCYGSEGNDITYTVDFTKGETLPHFLIAQILDPNYRKHAHNAVFEILCLESIGIYVDVEQWFCSMACCAFCTLPLGLEAAADALGHDQRKLKTGTALIRKFSVPDKHTGMYANPNAQENFNDWSEYIKYNKQDVITEKYNLLCLPEIPEIFDSSNLERNVWLMDFKINYNGVDINLDLAKACDELCEMEDAEMIESFKHGGINNINSSQQVKEFLSKRGYVITTMRAADYEDYLKQTERDEIANEILRIKQNLSLTSASKFKKFVDTELNGKIYGTLQYYGAVRTGRWGGRGAQPQNLKRNDMPFDELQALRYYVKNRDYKSVKMYFGSVKKNIIELCRTVVEPTDGYKLLATDFSAIEARVTAFIAQEEWRLEVFRTHGKIYEASAAMMYKMKVEDIKKGSVERMKGKCAELALGFSGWIGAFKKFGGDKFMTDEEMKDTANKWRQASPNIVAMWSNIEECAINACRYKGKYFTTTFGATYYLEEYKGREWLMCILPSGRRIMYYQPVLKSRRDAFGNVTLALSYKRGADENDTWRGALTENIVQAIARDLLCEKKWYIYKNYGRLPVLHVHDELVYKTADEEAEEFKKVLDNVMSLPVSWCEGLPLKGDTDILPFYMKAS